MVMPKKRPRMTIGPQHHQSQKLLKMTMAGTTRQQQPPATIIQVIFFIASFSVVLRHYREIRNKKNKMKKYFGDFPTARKNDGWNTKKNDDSWGNDWADTSNDWGSTSHGNNRANNNKRYGERSFNNEPPKKKPFSGIAF